jgi:tRNA threonylcarbamoyladenosine biosynthesis protein TsaB
MALQLAYETSGNTCGVSLHDNNELIAEYSLYVKNIHDAALAELTNQLLRSVGQSANDIDFVSISAGPGSFTGLRIGYSFVKGFLFHTNIQLVSVPSLHSVAHAAIEFAQYCDADSLLTIVHSHKDLFYVQHFNKTAQYVGNIEIMNYESIMNIPEIQSKILCGPGALHFQNIGKQLSGLNRLTPRFIGKLGAIYYANGQIADTITAEPLYVQAFNPS